MSTGRMIGNCGKIIDGTIVATVIVRLITMDIRAIDTGLRNEFANLIDGDGAEVRMALAGSW